MCVCVRFPDCMYVYVCVCIHVCTLMCVCTREAFYTPFYICCTCMYSCSYASACTYIYFLVRIHAYVGTYTHTWHEMSGGMIGA
jgi:hypothetical protein